MTQLLPGTAVTLTEPVGCMDGTIAPTGMHGLVIGPNGAHPGTVDVRLSDKREAYALVRIQVREES